MSGLSPTEVGAKACASSSSRPTDFENDGTCLRCEVTKQPVCQTIPQVEQANLIIVGVRVQNPDSDTDIPP